MSPLTSPGSMGLILDSSILIAAERGMLDLISLLENEAGNRSIAIAALTAAELLHGCERAPAGKRRQMRQQFVEDILDFVPTVPFDLDVAREHARLWARLAKTGELIGAHDLMIAATCLYRHDDLATLNVRGFARVPGLVLLDAGPYLQSGE